MQSLGFSAIGGFGVGFSYPKPETKSLSLVRLVADNDPTMASDQAFESNVSHSKSSGPLSLCGTYLCPKASLLEPLSSHSLIDVFQPFGLHLSVCSETNRERASSATRRTTFWPENRAKLARFLASAGGSRDHPELLWTPPWSVEALRLQLDARRDRTTGQRSPCCSCLTTFGDFSATFGLFDMRKASCPRCGHVPGSYWSRSPRVTFDRSVFFPCHGGSGRNAWFRVFAAGSMASWASAWPICRHFQN